jgi:hypothetical protein
MTTAVQHRRGTTAEHATFTGLEGEVTIDTTKDTAVIHDGALAGGYPLAKENLANVTPSGLPTIDGASTAADDKFFIYDQSTTTLKSITRAELNNAIEQDALANVAITGGTINGTTIGGTTAAAITGTTITANSGFSGNLTGNVTGNVSGNAGTVTNGVYTTGDQTIAGVKTLSSNPILSAGVANGIPYLNASKVLTSGSALTFDGTNLGVAGDIQQANATYIKGKTSAGIATRLFGANGANNLYIGAIDATIGDMLFVNGGYEQMRLTSTGLLIGRSSHTANSGIFEVDANGIGSTVYTAKIINSNTGTSVYNVVTWAQGAAGSAVGYIGTGGSTVGNDAFKNSFVVGTQSASPLVFSTGDTERARIAAGGEFLVGQTGTGPVNAYSFAVGVSNTGGNDISHPSGAASGIMYERFNYGGSTIGSITQNGTTAVSYNTTSDYRLKTVIGSITDSGARIDALEPIEYEWKTDGSRTRGFLAHKFQEVYAGSVTGSKDAVDKEGKPVYQAMQAGSSEVIADLVAEIQSLRKRLAAAGI